MMLWANSVFSQVDDNFTDGNFNSLPEWKGDLTAFTINSGKQLQTTQNASAQTFSLATTNLLAVNTKWEFFVQLNFDPSTNNQIRIYLTSDNENLKGSLNGYFIQIGETGSTDSYDLYRQSGTTVTKIIDGPVKTRISANQLLARIQITRTTASLWELKTDITGGTNFVTEGTVTDNTFTSSSWFGVYCKYTTTNSDKFIFDDFKAQLFITDNISPKLASASVIDSLTIDALFDEPIDSLSAKVNNNFFLNNGYNNPGSISTTPDPAKYRLKYPKAFQTGNYVLTASTIKDRNNNTISENNTATFSYVRPYIAIKNDLVINEIFPDPTPQIDLPSVEFVELLNTTNHIIYLKNWKYADASTTVNLPADSILAGQFLILSAKADTTEFKKFGKTLGISPWPSLNNGSDILKLTSPENKVIDSVAYSDSWYRDPVKKQGGWTLERMDPKCLCKGLFNWMASSDISGGTPGKQNSIYYANYDQLQLTADSVKQLSDSTLKVFFNKHIDGSTAQAAKFKLDQAAVNLSAVNFDADYTQATLIYSAKFSPDIFYRLAVSGISDCSGNIMVNQFLTFKTPLAPVSSSPPIRLDTAKIYITEIFADPSPEVNLPLAEFVEIYNPGKDTIDLDGWIFNDPTTKATLKRTTISPKEYVILCSVADTLQYKAFGKTVGISPWPSLNNGSDQIVLKSFKGRIVDSISYTDTWYKDAAKKSGGWSLERIDPLSICQKLFNWTASTDKNGGTPGTQNSVYQVDYDKLVLKADSLKQLSDSTILVFFNKHIDGSTVQSGKNNLDLSGEKPSSITFDQDYRLATLTYSSKFKPATTYKLSISEISDCSGNTISLMNQPLTFQTTGLALTSPSIPARMDTAKIYITEIFADPSPEVKLPLSEFVELYNPGKDTIDLDGWIFSDPVTKATIKRAKIFPKEYLILCPAADTIQYKPFGKTIGLTPWPSLNNASDQIVLKSFKNRMVDSVSYSDSWYKDSVKKPGGWTLEKTEAHLVNNFYSWTASENLSGGTPGRLNSVAYYANKALTLSIDSISISSDSTIRVTLNSIPDTVYIKASYFNLNLIGKAQNILLTSNYKQIDLKFPGHFEVDKQYLLMVDSLRTSAGILIDPIANQKSFTIPSVPAEEYKVIITEIFADPSPQIGLPDSEFIELFNYSDKVVNLKGMIYEDASGSKYTFKAGSVIAGEYLIICPEKDTLSYKPFGRVLGISTWPSLNNDKDVLILRNNKGKEFHRVVYSNSWYKNKEKLQGGWSLELIDPQAICSGFQNWMASVNTSGGTPGKQNSVYKIYDVNEPVKITNAILIDSATVQLSFNRSIDSLSASSNQNFKLNNGLGTPVSVLPVAPDFNQVILKFSSAIARGNTYRVISNNITDCAGTIITASSNSAEFIYPEKIAQNDILINEVLFNPRPGGVDFVEIYNKSDKLLDLKDLYIATTNNKDSLIGAKQLSSSQLLMQPHTYRILTTDPDNIKKEYSVSDPDAFIKMPLFPSYNDDAGIVVLYSENSRIDQLNYSEKMHFALIKNPEGVSLERSSFTSLTNETGNFRSAAASAGYATPGYKNSQYAENTIPGNAEVVFLSKTFSPDNDGFEDLLSLNYNFPRSGMIANSSIYNDKGILIRKLIRNMTLSETGTITWDGLTETNELCPVGIYIVYLEVFNLDGTVKKYRKNCVLAAKLN
jgi:hypothetical protein